MGLSEGILRESQAPGDKQAFCVRMFKGVAKSVSAFTKERVLFWEHKDSLPYPHILSP